MKAQLILPFVFFLLLSQFLYSQEMLWNIEITEEDYYSHTRILPSHDSDDFYVLFRSISSISPYSYRVAKYDSQGQIIWDKSHYIGQDEGGRGNGFALTSEGDVIVVGNIKLNQVDKVIPVMLLLDHENGELVDYRTYEEYYGTSFSSFREVKSNSQNHFLVKPRHSFPENDLDTLHSLLYKMELDGNLTDSIAPDGAYEVASYLYSDSEDIFISYVSPSEVSADTLFFQQLSTANLSEVKKEIYLVGDTRSKI